MTLATTEHVNPPQLHLELWVDDLKGFQVSTDPAGHPLCLYWAAAGT